MNEVIPFPGGLPSHTTDLASGPSGGNVGGMPPDDPMAVRVALLEQTAASTKETLGEIKADVRLIRSEATANRAELMTHIREVREKQERDFRIGIVWTATVGLALAGLLAKGFNWI